jgi:adenine-specific DNA-methyltransferase
MDHIKKFQELLRELFQFDAADLDFGIYRLMNHKRAIIERFIAEDLPRPYPKNWLRARWLGRRTRPKSWKTPKRKFWR